MRTVERHPLWLRTLHWLNVPFLALMVWSGILIYWANDVYRPFFPQAFYRLFHIDHRLAEGMAIHFTVGWLLVLNGLFFGALTLITRHWREFVPTRSDWKRLPASLRSEMSVWGPGQNHHARAITDPVYTPAQKVAYSGFFALVTLEILTGFAIYKPVQLGWLRAVFGGYEFARLIHFAGMLALCAFVLVHVIQVLRAGWNTFRSMIAGFEAEP